MNFIKQISAVSQEFHKVPFAGEGREGHGGQLLHFIMNHTASSSPRSSFIGLRRKTAFTLLEMLVVMAIIVLLAVVALPSLSGLNSGGSRRAAIGQLMGVFDQARMLAISDNRATYVVMADSLGRVNEKYPYPRDLVSLQGRAYAIFEDKSDFSGAPEQRTAWMFLPGGVSFKVNDGNQTTVSIMNRPLVDADPVFAIRNPVVGKMVSPAPKMPYVRFDATGSIDQQIPQYLRLLLFPGSINDSGGEVPIKRIAGTADQRKLLFDEIRFNQVTGRVKYVVDPADNLTTTQAAAGPN